MDNILTFYSRRYRGIPYIKELIEYENDGTKGYILFDGAYYVISTIDISDKKDFKSIPCDENLILIYKKECIYEIQIYKVDIIEDTSVISKEEDVFVCFFPTHIQKIYFNIISRLDFNFLKTEDFKKYKCKQWDI